MKYMDTQINLLKLQLFTAYTISNTSCSDGSMTKCLPSNAQLTCRNWCPCFLEPQHFNVFLHQPMLSQHYWRFNQTMQHYAQYWTFFDTTALGLVSRDLWKGNQTCSFFQPKKTWRRAQPSGLKELWLHTTKEVGWKFNWSLIVNVNKEHCCSLKSREATGFKWISFM